MPLALNGKNILVTGATGFIGGRLIERIALNGKVRVRALIRNPAKAVRISRFNVEMISGDILDRASVDMAVKGCEIVFHCAWGDRKVNIDGTRNILDSSISWKINRLIHLSTTSVYGAAPNGDLSESSPKQHIEDEYATSKLEGERLVIQYFKKYGLTMGINPNTNHTDRFVNI